MRMNIDDLLTAADIARAAKVHRSTVGYWIERGYITPALERTVEGKTRAEKFYRRADAEPLIAKALASKPQVVPSES